ncbi:MAG: helix-hairpin-helix domain-containing protein [Mogibacterium sp.]|nr:helix-hairpin-helix domain-containing protein [Mogibacterium sp.]
MSNNVVEKIRSFLEDVIRDRKTLIKILSIILILLTALIFRMHSSAADSRIIEAEDAKASSAEEADEGGSEVENDEAAQVLYVDIGGAVKKAGVYKVGPGTRLYEVIEMAGGLRDDADTNSVNQAAFVEDGQKIIIPVRNDDAVDTDLGSIPDNSGTSSQSNAGSAGFVNINTAGRDELMSLNGIGDVLADRIIEYRKSNVFSKKEDIMSVNGIGASKFDKIKDQIII